MNLWQCWKLNILDNIAHGIVEEGELGGKSFVLVFSPRIVRLPRRNRAYGIGRIHDTINPYGSDPDPWASRKEKL